MQGRGGPRGPPAPCWFCLASPNVDTHLIVCIGTEAYVALPKGGVDDNHVLIVPVSHHPNTVMAPDAVTKEMDVYASAIQRYGIQAPLLGLIAPLNKPCPVTDATQNAGSLQLCLSAPSKPVVPHTPTTKCSEYQRCVGANVSLS